MTGLPPRDPSPQGDVPQPAATSGAAVAGLVCGLLSLCSMGLTAIPGIILGLVGLARIRASAGRLRGSGLAAAGIVTSVIGLLIGLVVVGCLLLGALTAAGRHGRVEASVHVRKARQVAERRADASMRAMLVVTAAVRACADDHDGRLPPADKYPGVIAEYLPDDIGAPAGWAFAMNEGVSGMRVDEIAEPGRTVLLFEVREGMPLAGGRELVGGHPGRDEACVIGFADGHVERIPFGELDNLIWRSQRDTSFVL